MLCSCEMLLLYHDTFNTAFESTVQQIMSSAADLIDFWNRDEQRPIIMVE